MSSIDLNTLGLIFDIIGVLLLFKFGLTANPSKEGAMNFVFEGVDEKIARKWRKYNFFSILGIILVIVGFILQIISNYIS